MKFRNLLSLSVLCFFQQIIQSQNFHGSIVGADKLPIPYATIYIEQLKTGTATNANGKFELKLATGKYNIEFRALGYQSKKIAVEVLRENVEMNVVLDEQIYSIQEIVVKKGDEDPAYGIMRKAISLAPYYQNQVKHFKSKYYIKFNGNFIFLPKYLLTLMKLDKNAPNLKSGDVYFAESVNEVTFDAPDKVFQKVISFKTTFPKEDKANPMYVGGSFYEPKFWSGISPLAPNAFSYYKFRYEGVSFEKGVSILKIHVVPRYKGNNLFTGYIYLADKTFNLYTIDLTMPISNGVGYYKQQFVEVKEHVWLPATFSVYNDLKGFGAKAAFHIMTTVKYDEVEVNSQQIMPKWLERNIETENKKVEIEVSVKEKSRKQKKIEELLAKENLSTRDMLKLAALLKKQAEEARDTTDQKEKLQDDNKFRFKIETDALKNDSSFWNELRPIPLTAEELKSVKIKDSLTVKPVAIDTLTNDSAKQNIAIRTPAKVSPVEIVMGSYWRDSLSNELNFSGLVNPEQFWFNTVDGFGYSLRSKVTYKIDSSYSFSVEPQIGYAFSRKEIYWKINSGILYSPRRIGGLSIDAGHWSADFNGSNGIKRGVNTLSSLLFRTNYMKLYDSKFYKLGNSIELTNGLILSTRFVYDKRTELQNKSDFSFFYTNNRDYSSNVPVNENINANNAGNYVAFNFEAGVDYTPNMHYRYGSNKLKMNVGSDYPTFSLNVKKGIAGAFNSKSDFVFVSGGISQQFKWGIASKFDYKLIAGAFPVKRSLHFVDYYHVFTQESPVVFTVPPISFFSLLSYYKTSTPNRFVEAHANYSSAYMALKFLPLLNLTNLRENLSFGFLSTPKDQKKEYFELGYSLSNLPFKGSIGYVAGFDRKGCVAQGFKLMFLFGNTIVIGGDE